MLNRLESVGIAGAAHPLARWTVVFTLIGLNYHFVGDTIGGAFFGVLVGMVTTAGVRRYYLAPTQ